MSKDQTLKALFKMLYWANLSDTDQAKPWQRPDMAYGDAGLYGHLSAAIEAIEPGAVQYWADCGEWDQGNFDADKKQSMSSYNWVITHDFVEDGLEIGLSGPSNKLRHTDNETAFRMFDDDGKLYYAGTIWGDYDGFEPLDDFGMPSAGCTEIQLRDADGIFRTV